MRTFFPFFLLNISPWFCQSVLNQPFRFLADSSTIPSEMLIWQLSAPVSAFPSLTSSYLVDENSLLEFPVSRSLPSPIGVHKSRKAKLWHVYKYLQM